MEMEHNPYQSPATVEPTKQDRNARQAGRGSRFAAVMLDVLIAMAVVVPIQYMAGAFDGFLELKDQGLGELLKWGVVDFAFFLLINGYLLATRAQTVGKAALGIKIVTLDGQNADFECIIIRRVLPLTIASYIPVVGVFLFIIDGLSIFKKDHRCVHDLIAGTRVVVV